MKSKLALVAALVPLSSAAYADPALVSVVVCQPGGAPCERIMVDKALASLYKTTIQGTIVNNSTDVDNEDEAKNAMRECNQLKRKYDADAQPGTSYACRLEPADER